MAQDNASQHEVRAGNGSPPFYQSEDASIVLGRRKTKPHAFAVDRNSASLPISILGERPICWTSEYLDLTGLQDANAIPTSRKRFAAVSQYSTMPLAIYLCPS
jgi:hypothetical protein